MSLAQLQAEVQPICSFVRTLDFTNDNVLTLLEENFPISSLDHIRSLVLCGLEQGWLCPRGESPLTYGRVQKTSEDMPIGIDSVDMNGSTGTCAGPGHEHPNGEIDLCFAVSGSPEFDGHKEGWTVYPPKSWHIPTVQNGRMAILYFLPNGAIRFGAKEV